MDNFVLTNENYYSDEANKRYMSNSLFKALYGFPGHPDPCQAAELLGEKVDTEALIAGSYVDAWFEGEDSFNDYCTEHSEQLMLKTGKAKRQFVKDADAAIEKVSKDKQFMKFMGGSHQTIMIGEIAGQPFKIKMDAYHEDDMIVDLKYVKSAAAEYNPILKKYTNFIENYGYFIQGAIYQEIVYQNTGHKLPFYIAYITKESEPDFGIVNIPQDKLDEALEYVKTSLLAIPIHTILANPKKCNRRSCPYCKKIKVLSGPMTYEDFEKYSET